MARSETFRMFRTVCLNFAKQSLAADATWRANMRVRDLRRSIDPERADGIGKTVHVRLPWRFTRDGDGGNNGGA